VKCGLRFLKAEFLIDPEDNCFLSGNTDNKMDKNYVFCGLRVKFDPDAGGHGGFQCNISDFCRIYGFDEALEI
jgi:hypothetical protein